MKIISSELYVKDNKVYHEGNKPKPKDIGAAPETHTHNYASATTPGGSAEHAIKATEDSLGQRIDTYIKGLSVSGRTITYTRGDGTTGTITTQDNNTDTKVTNTLNTTAKAYITGTTDSATNTGTQVFDTNVYLDTTAGMLTATTFKGALQGNAATATSATSASHAAKLTTPRSINGTNFDGTAAITTANWGTARTLTIGDTGKSVNGSGNVSWSIGEIGAAPTVHNHTSLTGITNLSFAAEGSDSASITTTVEGANTYFDFNLSDDPSQEDMWRWRFRPSGGANVFNAMTLDAISSTEAKLTVTGEVQATRLKGTLTGDVKGNVTGTVSGNAGSATKLATARTINGTSFDGTGNITTANWGTARNIQIGNAVKSVNGSANVTWNWSEMQVPRAYSSSYSFGGNQNAITTAQFITMLTDLGAFSQVYWVSRGSWSYASNQYINDTGCGDIHLAGCVVEVIGTTSAYTIRVTTPTTTSSGTVNAEFIYVNNGGSYSPGWRRQYNTKNKPTPSEIGAAAASLTHDYVPTSDVAATATANKVAKLDGSADINVRLLRSNYANQSTISGALAYRVNNGSDNYLRFCSDTAAIRTWLGVAASSHTHNYAGSSSAGGAANTAAKLETARTIALGGILSGSASFDGSGNVTINATANDITTITKSLNVTTSWADTGITGSNLGTGTYVVQMYINDGTNTGHYNEYYSGIMSWYADGTNSTDADEILLHKAGHASNGRHVYLRTIRTGKSGSLKLQISCTHAISAASNITFKFKKLI